MNKTESASNIMSLTENETPEQIEIRINDLENEIFQLKTAMINLFGKIRSSKLISSINTITCKYIRIFGKVEFIVDSCSVEEIERELFDRFIKRFFFLIEAKKKISSYKKYWYYAEYPDKCKTNYIA